MNNLDSAQQKFLGPNYNYAKFIKTPDELNLSDEGSFDALSNNIAGIINYSDLLISGNSRASKTGQPLGNKFFISTVGKCKDINNKNKLVDRKVYINNVPTGYLGVISQMSGFTADKLKGFIPGIIQDSDALNPIKVMSALTQGSEPPCKKVSLEVVDENNRKSKESAYVSLLDLDVLEKQKEVPRGTLTSNDRKIMNNTNTTKDGIFGDFELFTNLRPFTSEDNNTKVFDTQVERTKIMNSINGDSVVFVHDMLKSILDNRETTIEKIYNDLREYYNYITKISSFEELLFYTMLLSLVFYSMTRLNR